jgi:hypothetical protein
MIGQDDRKLNSEPSPGTTLSAYNSLNFKRSRKLQLSHRTVRRRALFGRYRNPFTDDPAVAGVDRTVANTTPIWHAGRLLMAKEDGRVLIYSSMSKRMTW